MEADTLFTETIPHIPAFNYDGIFFFGGGGVPREKDTKIKQDTRAKNVFQPFGYGPEKKIF